MNAGANVRATCSCHIHTVARTVGNWADEVEEEEVLLSSSTPETKKPPPITKRRLSESATASKRAAAMHMCTARPRAPGVGVGADLAVLFRDLINIFEISDLAVVNSLG